MLEQNNEKSREKKGKYFVIIGATFWGIISLFTIPLSEMGFDSVAVTFIRSLLSSFLLAIFIFFKDKKLFKISIKDIPVFIGFGTFSFCFVCLFYTESISLNGSALASMLMYSSPIWACIFSVIIFNEKVSYKKVILLFGIVLGIALLTFCSELIITKKGVLIGLLTGILLALYTVFGKIVKKKYSWETITFYCFVFSLIGASCLLKNNVFVEIVNKPKSLVYFSLLSIVSTLLAYCFYNASLGYVSLTTASMLSSLEIIVSTFCGLIFYNAQIGFVGYLGIIITIVSLYFT